MCCVFKVTACGYVYTLFDKYRALKIPEILGACVVKTCSYYNNAFSEGELSYAALSERISRSLIEFYC